MYILIGQKRFIAPVEVRSLSVYGLVNGHRLQDALTLDTNQTVTGTVHMLVGFAVPDGDLDMKTLNGANWTTMMEHGVHPAILAMPGLRKNVTIRNSCSIGGSLVADGLKVNGENLTHILDDLVYSVMPIVQKYSHLSPEEIIAICF